MPPVLEVEAPPHPPPRLPTGGHGPEPRPPEPDGDRGVDRARIGMLIFLGAETMLFAGVVAAFLVFRLGAPVWPPPLQPRLPVGWTALNTAVLLGSGYTMWRRRLGWTLALGAAFVGLQGREWLRLLHFGLTAASGVYAGTFYVVIGAHAVHAVAGLAALAVLRVGAVIPRRMAVVGLYWYFVVGLWPVLYGLVYLA